jgi:hypothetical protein
MKNASLFRRSGAENAKLIVPPAPQVPPFKRPIVKKKLGLQAI